MTKTFPIIAVFTAADTLCQLLQPVCSQVEIAGSIRRHTHRVKDIEIVCVPKPQPDLLGEPNYNPLLIEEQLHKIGIATFTKNGPKYKAFTFNNFPVDLFITTPEQWGLIFTIRTGPALFSKKAVTARKYGGYLASDLKIKDGRVWRGKASLQTPTERDFFSHLSCGWIPPALRSLTIGAYP